MADLSPTHPLPVPETDDLGRYLEDTITIDWQTPSVTDCARDLLAGLGESSAEARIERLFGFVRDEIAHSFDLASGFPVGEETARSGPADGRAPRLSARPDRPATTGLPSAFFERGIACRASEVLALGHGLCFAKSHLLAALLRFAGHPTGFCYVRLVDDERSGRFTLHGFVACWEPTRESWVLLDPRGNRGAEAPPGSRGGSEPDRFEAGPGAERPAIESLCRFDPPYSLAYAPDPERGESLLPFIYKRPAKRIVDFLERVPDQAALRRNLPDSIG